MSQNSDPSQASLIEKGKQRLSVWAETEKGRRLFARISEELRKRPYLGGVPYWCAAILVGFVAALYSEAFSGIIEAVQSLTQSKPWAVALLAPACFVASRWVVLKFAPAAEGPGVGRVTEALSLVPETASIRIEQILGWRVPLVVMVSSLLLVAGAGALGREGPMVHIAAALFYLVGRTLRPLWPLEEHRSWVMAGGAAGIAAAFNTPLAGIVFVLEELASQHFHQFKTVIISAVIVAGMISQWMSGKYLFLGYPIIDSLEMSVLPWVVVTALLCALASVLFGILLRAFHRWSEPARVRHPYLLAAGVGLAMAGVAYFVSVQSVGGGIKLIEDLLFYRVTRADWTEVAVRFFGPVITHMAGCAGGFLAPSLSLGASVGSVVSAWISPNDHNLLALVGMTSFLAATTRAPFTALVIVMEMTDRHSIIFLLMIAALVGTAAGRALGKPSHA